MKRTRILSLLAALALTLSLAACTQKPSEGGGTKTPEELTTLYTDAITAARSAEDNEAVGLITSTDADLADMVLPMVGITAENATAFAVAVSPMNIRAYGIVAVMPAAGQEDTVKEALQGFIDTQKQSFEGYLIDQYDIANAAKLSTLADGTVLMVMSEGQDALFDAIKDAIEK